LISILITAPVGAVATIILGPMWLDCESEEEKKERQAIELEIHGVEKIEDEKAKQEKLDQLGTTSGKSLGLNPKFALSRSVSSSENAVSIS